MRIDLNTEPFEKLQLPIKEKSYGGAEEGSAEGATRAAEAEGSAKAQGSAEERRPFGLGTPQGKLLEERTPEGEGRKRSKARPSPLW